MGWTGSVEFDSALDGIFQIALQSTHLGTGITMIYIPQSLQGTNQEYGENYMPSTGNWEMIVLTQRPMEMNTQAN